MVTVRPFCSSAKFSIIIVPKVILNSFENFGQKIKSVLLWLKSSKVAFDMDRLNIFFLIYDTSM